MRVIFLQNVESAASKPHGRIWSRGSRNSDDEWVTGRLEERVALVFGAGSSDEAMSNGRAAAIVFAREGAQVAAIDREPEQAQRTADLITAEGGTAVALTADVTREDEVVAVIGRAREQLGAPSVLHNNVSITVTGNITELDLAEWDRSFTINLGGVFLACKHTIPIMVEAGHGAVVNVSSVAGIRWTGYPYPAYMAAKSAVNQLTVALALRYAADGLRVNAVLPGLIDTPLATHLAPDAAEARDAASPTGRAGSPRDVAHAAAFLASDEAAYVNAVCLPVDGGLSARCG